MTESTEWVRPDPPAGLKEAGLRLWNSILDAGYELRPDELCVLEQAAKTADVISRLERAAEVSELTAFGSQRQVIIHPVITELRQYRAVLARLLAQLALPDIDEDVDETDVAVRNAIRWRARKAARARWSA